MSLTKPEQEALRSRIADHLVELSAMFPGYRLTFLARAPHLHDGDVLVTNDECSPVLAAIDRLSTYEPV